MKHTTIKDLARELNVSVSTISRAFNDKYDVRKDTREKILKKAREMGYKPNPIAKKLIQKRSFNVGIVVPEFVNSFFPKVIIGIQDVLLKAGYQVLIMQSNEDETTELENVMALERNMVDGMIISLCNESANINYYRELIEKGYPIVFFNRVTDQISSTKVVFDDYKWSFFATEHLIEQGYRKIFHLYSNPKITLSKTRIKGYKDALKKHGLTFNENMLFDGHFTIDGGIACANKMFENNDLPDAIFAANDEMAAGAMKVFKQRGYQVPKDLGVIGFSDSKVAEVTDPPITTVSQPNFLMGQEVAKLIIQRIDELNLNTQELNNQQITMGGKMIIRESSLRNLL